MSKKEKTRLVISFIGNTDLKYIEPTAEDMSPILRLLLRLKSIRPIISPQKTRLVLFDDDPPGKTDRAEFIGKIKAMLPDLGLDGLEVFPAKLTIERPTDLRGLYAQFGKWLPRIQTRSYDEVLFHVSSGTPYMQMTLFLYSSTLPPDQVSLYQTSSHREGTILKLQLPYVLASREDTRGQGGRKSPKLSPAARRGLLTDTVVEDPMAEEVYGKLHEMAAGRIRNSRVLIFGSTGSGKWHAARQFGSWRGKPEVILSDPQSLPDDARIPGDATVLVRRLDRWTMAAMSELVALQDRRPDVMIVATCRTGRHSAARSAVLSDGLPGAVHLELPAVDERVDVVRLGEAIARRAGISDGKLRARLQHDWLADRFPRGLHDIQTLVTTGALLSETKHPERESYRRVADAMAARDVLDEAWAILESLAFDPPNLTLAQVEADIRRAAVKLALSRQVSQKTVGKLMGFSQQTVSRNAAGEFHLNRPPQSQDD